MLARCFPYSEIINWANASNNVNYGSLKSYKVFVVNLYFKYKKLSLYEHTIFKAVNYYKALINSMIYSIFMIYWL